MKLFVLWTLLVFSVNLHASGDALKKEAKPSLPADVLPQDRMTQEHMESIVKSLADRSFGENGVVEFVFQGINMFLISNVAYDRMRIISPIAEYSGLTHQQITNAMESNFHSALDARYALSNNMLYSAYIHPLSKLDESQLRDAIVQVFNLKASFGSAYTSGLLDYQGKEHSQNGQTQEKRQPSTDIGF